MTRFVFDRRVICLALCLMFMGVSTAARGTSLVSIGDGQPVSWSNALAEGRITPAESLTSVAEEFYAQSIAGSPTGNLDSVQAVQPRLENLPVADTQGLEFDSLVMSWDAPASSTALAVAAWDLNFLAGPVDLRDYDLHFSLLPPPGIWDISVELIDANGNSRAWFLPMPTNPGVWEEHWLWLNKDMPQGPFTVFLTDAAFDLSQVVALRLDEAGNSVTLTDPTTGLPGVWNAWNHVTIKHTIPEPVTAVLGLMGLTGLCIGTTRRSSA